MKPIHILALAMSLGATANSYAANLPVPNPTALGWRLGDPYSRADKYTCCGSYLTNPTGGSLGKQIGYVISSAGQEFVSTYPNTYIPDLKPKGSEVTHAASGNDGYIEGWWTLPDKSVLFVAKVAPSGSSYLYKMTDARTVGNNATHDNQQAVLNMGERNGVPQANVGILHQHSLLVAKVNNATVLFYGEYNTSKQTPVALWKSTDMGDTWSPVIEWNTAGNINSVRQDPINGWIYLAMDSGIIAWDGVSAPPPNDTPLSQIQAGNYPGWIALTGSPNVVAASDILFTPAPDKKVVWIPNVHSLAAGQKLFSQRANYDLTGLEAIGEVPYIDGHPPALASIDPLPTTGNMITWVSGIDASASERKIHVWESTDLGKNWVLRSKVDVYNKTAAVPSGFYGGLSGRELEFVATGKSEGSIVNYLKPPYLVQKLLTTKADSYTAENRGNLLAVLDNDGNQKDDLTEASFVLTQPQHGTVQANYSTIQNFNDFLSYIPTPGYVGPDSFTYALKNTAGISNVSQVTLNVVDNRPIAKDDTYTVPAGSSYTDLDIAANDNPNGIATPGILIETQPSHGALDASAGGLSPVRYMPFPDFSGTDTFTYRLYDTANPDNRSDLVTVTINVTGPVPPPKPVPVANPDSVTTAKNQAITINVVGNDTDVGSSAVYYVDIQGLHGTVTTGSNNTFIYTPPADYVGTDQFQYALNSGGGVFSNTTTVTITVTNTPVTPPKQAVAKPDKVTTTKQKPVTIDLTKNDANVGNSKVNIVTYPDNGDIQFVDSTHRTVVFTPNNNFVGKNTFSYNLKDGTTTSNTAKVAVTVSN